MLSRILTFLISVGVSLSSLADNWVKLDATNFKDAEFRNYLKACCKTGTGASDFNPDYYDSANNLINCDMINEVNINYKSGSKNGITVNYPAIKTLEGIKLLRAVTTITLPEVTAQNRKPQLQSLDVSGMPNLVTITNGTKYEVSFNANNSGATYRNKTSTASNSVAPITSIKADNCPKLKTLIVSLYNKLTDLSFENSPNIEELEVFGTGITKLDVSKLNALNDNTRNVVSATDADFTPLTGIVNAYDAMKLYRAFSLTGCSNLEELNLGNQDLHWLDVSGCDKLKVLDVSGQTNLMRLYGVMSSATTLAPNYNTITGLCKHQYTHRGKGSLEKVIFGNHPNLYYVCITNNPTLKRFDLESIASTIKHINVSGNQLRKFDISLLKRATKIDVSYNRIHKLVPPPNKSTTSFSYFDNCITYIDQFGTTYYTGTGNNAFATGRTYQFIRVGKVYRYKLFDDPDYAQYVEEKDDPNSTKYYLGTLDSGNGHIGNPANKETYFKDGPETGRMEDPRYFYFDDDYQDGMYFIRNFFTKGATVESHPLNGWIKFVLCRTEALDFDPDETKFYIAGDFNNWQPTEKDAFAYNPDADDYWCQYTNSFVYGNFRIWDSTNPDDVNLNIGGHSKDYANYKGHENHVYFTPQIKHLLGTESQRHYTTFTETDKTHGYFEPSIQMVLRPGQESSNNFVTIGGGLPTGVENIIASDPANSNAPVEYFDLQGHRVINPSNGLYIRRQGNCVSKEFIH